MPDARFTAHGLTYWKDLPFIIDADAFGVMAVDTARAVAHGFKQRSLRDTVADTLTWDRTRDPNQDLQAGFGPEVEQRILATPGGV